LLHLPASINLKISGNRLLNRKNGVKDTLHKEYRLRVFENRVLRRIFKSKREEVVGNWRRLHNEELHSSYAS
jgi:di/tripeptidase